MHFYIPVKQEVTQYRSMTLRLNKIKGLPQFFYLRSAKNSGTNENTEISLKHKIKCIEIKVYSFAICLNIT